MIADEAEIELLFRWENLFQFLLYTFFIIIMMDSALFRAFFRLVLSVGFGVVGYLYTGDCFMQFISYTAGIIVFLIFIGINFYKVKNLYDI